MPFEAATLCFRLYTNSTEQHLRNPVPNANNPHLWKTIPCSRSKQKHTLVTHSKDGQPMEVMRFNLADWLIACSVPKSLHHFKGSWAPEYHTTHKVYGRARVTAGKQPLSAGWGAQRRSPPSFSLWIGTVLSQPLDFDLETHAVRCYDF